MKGHKEQMAHVVGVPVIRTDEATASEVRGRERRAVAACREGRDEAIDRLVFAARVYLAWLESDRPLDDQFRAIKARIVTLACNVANAK